MTYPDRISAVTENLDSYAKAFAELKNHRFTGIGIRHGLLWTWKSGIENHNEKTS